MFQEEFPALLKKYPIAYANVKRITSLTWSRSFRFGMKFVLLNPCARSVPGRAKL